MIGNKYLSELYKTVDEDTALNQIMEMLKSNDIEFIESLKKPINIDLCDTNELEHLTKIVAIIDYFLQLNGMEVPNWIRDKRLAFQTPYYHSRRISDFEKIRLIYSSPAPFRARNVYFDLDALTRI